MKRNDMIHYFKIVLKFWLEKEEKKIYELENIAQTLCTEIAEMKKEDIEHIKPEIQKVYMYIYADMHEKVLSFVERNKQYTWKLREIERVYTEAGEGKLEEIREFFGTGTREETVFVYFLFIRDIIQRKYAGFELKKKYNTVYHVQKKEMTDDIEELDFMGNFKLKKKIRKEVQNWQKMEIQKEKNKQKTEAQKIRQNLYFKIMHDENRWTYKRGYFSARFLGWMYRGFWVFHGSILFFKNTVENWVLKMEKIIDIQKIMLVLSFVFSVAVAENTTTRMYIYTHFSMPFDFSFPFIPVASPSFLFMFFAIVFSSIYFYICLSLILSLISGIWKISIAMIMEDHNTVWRVGNMVLKKIWYLILIFFLFHIFRK